MTGDDVQRILDPQHVMPVAEEEPQKSNLVRLQRFPETVLKYAIPRSLYNMAVTEEPIRAPVIRYLKPEEREPRERTDHTQEYFDRCVVWLIRTIEEQEPRRFAKTT